MRLLVCGSRDWTADGEIADQLALIFDAAQERVVIHGGCRGADLIAGFCAPGVGASVEAFPVDHAIDGPWPAAGPRRNERMLRESKPDRCLAFGALLKPSGTGRLDGMKPTGTGDMVGRCLAVRLPVRWILAPGIAYVDLTEAPRHGR